MIQYKPGYKYQLYADYTIELPWLDGYPNYSDHFLTVSGAKLTMHKGYAWDGASGGLDTKTAMRGSLVHDALYQLMREGVLPQAARPMADRALYDICLDDGMMWLRAWAWRVAVVKMGGFAARFTEDHKVQTAP